MCVHPELDHRHESVKAFVAWFEYKHLPDDLQEVSKKFHDLAHEMIQFLPDSPELSVGLRKLLEAKDCFVRASTLLDNIKKYEDTNGRHELSEHSTH